MMNYALSAKDMKGAQLRGFVIPGIVAVVCVFAPYLLINFYAIDAYTARVLTLGAVNAIMALSVNMICGITGQLSLGQAGFMALGAYSCAIITQAGVPMPLSVAISVILTAFAGLIIGFPTLKLHGDYLAIVTLGFGEIIRVFLVNFKNLTGGANGKQFISVMVMKPNLSWLIMASALVIVLILVQNILRSAYGRSIFAVREDEIAAGSCGISVFRFKMVGFIIASAIAGLAGSLYAPFIGFIQPDIASYNRSIDYLIFVVLGGMGSMTGSIVAAFVLTFLQEFLRFLQDYRLLIYPLILIIVMIFRPQGLLGMKEFSFVKAWEGRKNAISLIASRLKRLTRRGGKGGEKGGDNE